MSFRKMKYYRRRGRRAVASHAKTDPCNPTSFSRYIINEREMHHLQRKETILPCGFRVRESWAALRKAWQGFKIAHSTGDMARKKDYAEVIHKVQQEMGIGITHFEFGLVDEEEWTTGALPESKIAEVESSISANTNNDLDEEDDLPDFEGMLKNLPGNTGYPNPRKEIFVTHEDRSQSSCGYPDQNGADATHTNGAPPDPSGGMFATYKDRSESSCEYDYYKHTSPTVDIESHLIHPENSCQVDPKLEANKLEKERERRLRSCFYKSKQVHLDDKDSS